MDPENCINFKQGQIGFRGKQLGEWRRGKRLRKGLC
jgi:hypothetical protein